MPTPFLRNRGTLTGSNSSTLTLPLSGTTQVGDLVVVYNENYTHGVGTNTASPAVPGGFVELYNSTFSTGHKQILYAKATDSGFGSSIKLTAPAGMVTGQSWWGYVDTFGGVSWRTPGWLALPDGLGNHMTYTRADVAARTTHTFAVRVRFDTLGVDQWMIGWNTGDAGFGLNASDQPVIFIKNTLGNIIGNFPPASAVPGLTADKRVWLMGTVIASSAQCLYFYSYDDVEDYYSVHWTSMGFATGTNPATTMRVTNSDTVYVGTRDAATAAMAGRIYSYAELATDLTLSGTFSDPLPGAATVVGTADHVRPTDDNGNGSPIEDWGIGTFSLFVDDLYAPGRRAHGTDRLWYNAWLGNAFTSFNQPISGPLDWQVYPDRAVVTQSRYSKAVTRTRGVDVEGAYPDEPASLVPSYNFGVLSLMIRGTLPVVYLPPGPQSEHLRLGCADSYAVWITDETYTRTLEQVRWSDIQWGRVLDDISQASVTIPDELGGVHCVARYGGLEPWAYGLYLERDDREVWSGPIVNVRRNGTDITVSAADVFARYQKRFVARQPAAFEETDAGEAFRQIIEQHAHLDSDAWTLPVPGCFVNVPITRALKPREFKYAWDLIAELFDTAIDAYIANGVLYMFEPMHGWCYYDNRTRTLPGPYNTNYDFVYGTFTEEAWTTRPDWSIDGAGQANFCVVPAADSGEQGFRSYEWAENVESQARYGVLDTVDPESLGIPDDSPPAVVTQALRSRAQTINALRAIPPIVVEGGVLSENAPIDVDNLRPGSLWKMDVYDAGYGHLLTVGRLRRVNVSVSMSDSGLVEKVSATLYPPGWEGENV